MLGDLILWLTIAFPLILGVAFRVPAAHIFFSLMAGELLGRYFGHDIDKLVNSPAVHGFGEIALILIPMIVTGYLLRHTLSKARLLIQVVPLLVMGVICAAFILPVLPETLQDTVREATLGGTILDLNRAIVGGMVFVQLLSLWLMNRKKGARAAHGD